MSPCSVSHMWMFCFLCLTASLFSKTENAVLTSPAEQNQFHKSSYSCFCADIKLFLFLKPHCCLDLEKTYNYWNKTVIGNCLECSIHISNVIRTYFYEELMLQQRWTFFHFVCIINPDMLAGVCTVLRLRLGLLVSVSTSWSDRVINMLR